MKIIKCQACGFDRGVYQIRRIKMYLCDRHRAQVFKYGTLKPRTVQDRNEFIDCGDHYEVVIYNRERLEVARALIDQEDYDRLKDSKWSLTGRKGRTFYVGRGKSLKYNAGLMHKVILGSKQGFEIDHINGNRLDNRKSNLRFVTHQQNAFNTKSKGIWFSKNEKKWRAGITFNAKNISLGYYKTRAEARAARLTAEKQYFGEFRSQVAA